MYRPRRSGERGNAETHGEILRGFIGIGNVPVDEGDAGFKGRLVLEINSGVSKMLSMTGLRFGVAESSAVAQVMAEVGQRDVSA